MKRIVISGATGAIGIALIKKCISVNTEVLVLTHKNSTRNVNIPQSELVTVVDCDLDHMKDYKSEKCDTYDVFYHFAWVGGKQRNNTELQLKNIEYTIDAVNLAKRLGCKKFIGAGSQAEYGVTKQKLSGETPTFPTNVFGATKLYSGHLSRILCHDLGMEHVWTRILSVYGPYDGEQTMISSTIRKLLIGETPKFTKSEQIWDFLYSDDAAEAMYLIGEKGVDGKTYCIGSGEALPLREYILELHSAVNNKTNIEIGAIPYQDNQVMYLSADIKELSEDTSFQPRVSFSEGIRYTIKHTRKLLNID
jgi:nucleoside-diphosphate-sugar epimerase